MKTYKINGKDYTEFDINKRCAELEDKNLPDYQPARNSGYNIASEEFYIGYNPCHNPTDTWPIIEKCWDDLNQFVSGKQRMETKWIFNMQEHNCTKLVAACICFIMVNSKKGVGSNDYR